VSVLRLDHVAHYVHELEGAARSLEPLGFTVSPPLAQTTHAPDGALVPAGTAFRSVMLEEGLYRNGLSPLASGPFFRRSPATCSPAAIRLCSVVYLRQTGQCRPR